jgi:hypothetical protein
MKYYIVVLNSDNLLIVEISVNEEYQAFISAKDYLINKYKNDNVIFRYHEEFA